MAAVSQITGSLLCGGSAGSCLHPTPAAVYSSSSHGIDGMACTGVTAGKALVSLVSYLGSGVMAWQQCHGMACVDETASTCSVGACEESSIAPWRWLQQLAAGLSLAVLRAQCSTV